MENWSEGGQTETLGMCGGVKVDLAFPSLGPAPVAMTSDDGAAPDVMQEGSQAPTLVCNSSLYIGLEEEKINSLDLKILILLPCLIYTKMNTDVFFF